MRILSLLPSATEMVCALGLEDQLVGVTHECDYPASVRGLPVVTQTLVPTSATSSEIDALVRERVRTGDALYSLDIDALERLAPDLIITQALCDVCAVAADEVQTAVCRLPSAPRVINLEPQTLSQVLEALQLVADAADVEPATARAAIGGLRHRVQVIEDRVSSHTPRPRVAFLEWLDPLFCGGHWNPELVRIAGGIEMLGREGERSRTISWHELRDAQPEVIFIACCGFSAERTTADLPALVRLDGWEDLPAVRAGRVCLTDGSQYFNRPGPRLVDSLEILAHALHPDVHPLPSGLPSPLVISAKGATVAHA
jgi:iron complex transport system substrate-binding protein